MGKLIVSSYLHLFQVEKMDIVLSCIMSSNQIMERLGWRYQEAYNYHCQRDFLLKMIKRKISIIKISVVEVFVIILVGFVPGIIAYFFGGLSEFNTTLSSLMPTELVMSYTLVATLGSFLLSFVDYWFLKTSKLANAFFWFLGSVLQQVGAGVLSILRIGSGVFFCILFLWIVTDFNSIKAENIVFLSGYTIVMLVECILITFAHEYVNNLPKSKI